MRVALAGFALESVSFLPDCVDRDAMEACMLRGRALVDGLAGTASVAGGVLEVLAAEGVEPVPVLWADAFAAGPLADDAFTGYRDELAAAFRALRGTIDGALIFLHGAMTTPNLPHPDTLLLEAVRAALGPGVPLLVALDLHGNLEPRLAGLADGLVAFHRSPHIDMAETGARAARALIRTLRGEIRPRALLRKVPLVLPSIMTATDLQPLATIKAEAAAASASTPGVVDLSLLTGFAYADVPWLGASLTAVVDGDPAPAEALLDRLAARLWAARHDLLAAVPVHPLREGVRRAARLAAGADRPVVVLEHADRESDSTHGLRELLRQGVARAAVPYLVDPGAAALAMQAGEGAEVCLAVGGRSSERAGGPVEITGRVLFAGPKRYVGTGPMRKGRLIDLGPTAVIDTGRIVVSLITRPSAAIDRDPFDQLGLDPLDFQLVLLRSKTHFRAVWEALAAAIVIVDTPDWGTADLPSLPWRRVRPGVFPIDPAA